MVPVRSRKLRHRPGDGMMLEKEGVVLGTEVNAAIVYATDKRMKVEEYKAKVLWMKGDLITTSQ